ncbi:MAG: hypothetical protein JRF61_01485 [Deltaproteobacteria bacterium]|jgi:hypothetical protein|nr:hypothetical protein [Deltaproteobacteria bacterium]
MGQEEAVERLVDGRVWDDFCDRLKAIGHEVLDAAPTDPLDRAEGLRYVARLTRSFLRDLVSDAQPGRVTLGYAETPKIGLDNPDYVYCSASLDPSAEYVLRGELADAHLIGFGTYSGALGTPKGLICDGYLDSGALEMDEQGRFEIRLSQREQPGNWLAMGPQTNTLNARQTLLRRAEQRQAPLELVRLGEGAAPPPPLDPAKFSLGLDRVGTVLGGTVAQFLGWTEDFEAHKHEVREIDEKLAAVAQGDPNTSYHYSYWELGEDEAFVVDLEPPECEYWNLQIGNHWLESFDFMSFHTHVNRETAVADEQGRVRVVIAGRDPGVPNWLDTAGHGRGALALRWVGADRIPETRGRVVPIDALS